MVFPGHLEAVMTDLMVRDARISGASGLVDIEVDDGLIRSILPAMGRTAETVIDCAGRVVIPGLIEWHLNLDKALLDGERAGPDGTLGGAIAVTGELKRAFPPATVRDRARRVLDQAITNGTTFVRAHPDVDPIVGLMTLDVMLGVREEYRGLMDLQVVAFPQEGLLRAPQTLELLREGLRRGADVVGGCPYNEDSPAHSPPHVDPVVHPTVPLG